MTRNDILALSADADFEGYDFDFVEWGDLNDFE